MDARISTLLRDASAEDDGPAWARAAHWLLRAGELEHAAVGARKALARGADAMDVLDATTPALDDLEARVIEARTASGFRQLMDSRGVWAPAGGVLLVPGAFGADLGRPILSVDLTGGAARALPMRVRNLIAAAVDGPLVMAALLPGGIGPCDVASGLVGPSLDAWSRFAKISSVAVTAGPRRMAFVADSSRARAFALEADPPRLAWRLKCKDASFDPSGALVHVDGDALVLHDPLGIRPRARIRLRRDERRVAAAGFRAIAAGSSIRLVGASGELLGEAAIPRGDSASWVTHQTPLPFVPQADFQELRPCPSGRLVAYAESFSNYFGHCLRIAVVDLRSGRSQWFDAPGPVMDLAWSPSGRRLAVLVEHGQDEPVRVLLLAPRQSRPQLRP